MKWRSAPAVRAALAEASRRYPERSKVHDGTIGDAAHSSRTSDHNPDDRGVVLAFDLTCDVDAGCDAHALVRAAVKRRDPRIKYAISNGRIWSKARADEGWRDYDGSNAHTKHAHVSVDRAYEDDTSAWWADLQALKTPHITILPVNPPPPEDPDMRVVHAPERATCLLRSDGRLWPLDENTDASAYEAAGVPVRGISAAQWDSLDEESKRIAAAGL